MRRYVIAVFAGLFAIVLGFSAFTGGLDAQSVLDMGLENNVDRPGSDYRSITMATSDPRSCQAICDRDRQNCAAFTYVRPGVQGPQPKCYLKNKVPAAAANNCCVSGRAGGSWEPGIDRPGSDFTQVPATNDRQACRTACRANGQCRAFTYVDAGVQGPAPRCYLKNAVPDPVPNPQTTSGVMG
ncbi:MAG: peptidyl-Asp metalloendopeptidase [Sphingomonadales bacterium]|jgi:hypothetical protein|nr:peptidyl-Asp metalloendopeptidase [Sphingomonadales bacterium]